MVEPQMVTDIVAVVVHVELLVSGIVIQVGKTRLELIKGNLDLDSCLVLVSYL